MCWIGGGSGLEGGVDWRRVDWRGGTGEHYAPVSEFLFFVSNTKETFARYCSYFFILGVQGS
jgi:hypothetical protein